MRFAIAAALMASALGCVAGIDRGPASTTQESALSSCSVNHCELWCPDGYLSDANGCDLCQCAPSECRRTGCSGQICADQDISTTCEWRPEYACYATAICERQADGDCGWRNTRRLQWCLNGGKTTVASVE